MTLSTYWVTSSRLLEVAAEREADNEWLSAQERELLRLDDDRQACNTASRELQEWVDGFHYAQLALSLSIPLSLSLSLCWPGEEIYMYLTVRFLLYPTWRERERERSTLHPSSSLAVVSASHPFALLAFLSPKKRSSERVKEVSPLCVSLSLSLPLSGAGEERERERYHELLTLSFRPGTNWDEERGRWSEWAFHSTVHSPALI